MSDSTWRIRSLYIVWINYGLPYTGIPWQRTQIRSFCVACDPPGHNFLVLENLALRDHQLGLGKLGHQTASTSWIQASLDPARILMALFVLFWRGLVGIFVRLVSEVVIETPELLIHIHKHKRQYKLDHKTLRSNVHDMVEIVQMRSTA